MFTASKLLLQRSRTRWSTECFHRAREPFSGFGVWSYAPDAEHLQVRIRFTGWAARVMAKRHWHARLRWSVQEISSDV
jgi:hypothetical protein